MPVWPSLTPRGRARRKGDGLAGVLWHRGPHLRRPRLGMGMGWQRRRKSSLVQTPGEALGGEAQPPIPQGIGDPG